VPCDYFLYPYLTGNPADLDTVKNATVTCVCPLPPVPRGGAAGEGRVRDRQSGGPESVTLAGRAERARAARSFVSEVLGPGTRAGMWPCCWSARSSVIPSCIAASGAPGETVTVAVIAGDGVVRVEVTDRAGAGTPEMRPYGGKWWHRRSRPSGTYGFGSSS